MGSLPSPTKRGLCPSCETPLPHPGNCTPEWHAGPRPMYSHPTCRACGEECRPGRAYCGACASRMVEREAVAA